MARKKLKKRLPFTAVNPWMTQFSPIAERAVYDVFVEKSGINPQNVRKYSFSHCVNFLRRLEDPEYKNPTDQQSY